MNIDNELLEGCLKTLAETGHIVERKVAIDIFYTNLQGLKCPLATIFPDDRYIQFHDEFTQIGIEVPGLNKLPWSSNHT